MQNIHKLLNNLPTIQSMQWDDCWKRFIDVSIKPPVHIDEDGVLCISAESEVGVILAEYHGFLNEGNPYIHPDLEQWAESYGGYWEWRNSGLIALIV
jgi:hypothetical protein